MPEVTRSWFRRGTEVVTRRDALAMLGATGVALVAAACSGGGSDGSAASTPRSSPGSGTSTSGSSATSDSTRGSSSATTTVDCVLSPEMTEGPYYLDDQVIRRDVT